MRFSVLTLHAVPNQLKGVHIEETVERLSGYVAAQNVSCICVQECQPGTASVAGTAGSVPEASVASRLSARLTELGLKYGLFGTSSTSGSHDKAGCAILGQLPTLSATDARHFSFGRCGCAGDSPCSIVTRFAAAPAILIDVYTTSISPEPDGGAAQVAALREFIALSDGELSKKPQEARRRGRPPRVRQLGAGAQSVRIVLLAGAMPGNPDGPVATALRADGFADASRIVRDSMSDSQGRTAGTWNGAVDSVYIRPGLRPTNGAMRLPAFAGDDTPGSEGLLVEFEV